jgi:hypothetical protein
MNWAGLKQTLPRQRAVLPGSPLPWVYDDGGREAAGFRGETGDCVTRAIAIATGKPYREVYDHVAGLLREWAEQTGRARDRSPRNGVPKHLIKAYLTHDLGWVWHPTMGIGTGCQVHLAKGELPETGPLVVSLSKHNAAVVDGVVRDNHDPTRDGTRCVYGYWTPPQEVTA